MAIHDVAARFYREQLAASWVPGYLSGRGIGARAQRRWLTGYAPAGPDALVRHLRSAGYPDALIQASGLGRRSRRGFLTDTFRDRAVLPIRSPRGTIIAFIGRAAEHAGPMSPSTSTARAPACTTRARHCSGCGRRVTAWQPARYR